MQLPPCTARQLADIRQQLASGQPAWNTEEARQTQPEARIPVERYFSPEIWQQEVDALFRPLPLIAAHSSEIGPGQVLAHDGYGVPLLLARDAQGRLGCFLNVCRHRGMRLADTPEGACPAASLVCPYHAWTYRLDGTLRHLPHGDAFDACGNGERNLVTLPCEERHGLVWVVPSAGAALDLPGFLGGLDAELPFFDIDGLRHWRTTEAEYPANWKLVIDAFLEPYHVRVLHRDTVYPFFTDGVTAFSRFGPHVHSLVARRLAQDWASGADHRMPASLAALRQLVTPTQVIFPNTVAIHHPDYLSLITLYPAGPERLRWTHRMLVPADKASPDWQPHWDKSFRLIEQGVFRNEDVHCAIGIQRGLKTGANRYLTFGRLEQAVPWFHASVQAALEGASHSLAPSSAQPH